MTIISTDNKLPADIQVIKEIYGLRNMTYNNIARQEKLSNIIKRWPLLTELYYIDKD